MSSDGHGQLTAVLGRLGSALSLLNPMQLVPVIRSVVRELGTPPPGDPAALRELATAFRVAAAAIEPVAAQLGDDAARTGSRAARVDAAAAPVDDTAARVEPRAGRVDDAAAPGENHAAPAGTAWLVATDADQVVDAVATAVRGAPAELERAAAALDVLADRVAEQQRRHAELREALRAAVRDATHVGRLPLPDPTALDELARAAAGLIRGCVAVYTDAVTAADEAAGVFADVAGAARTSAGVAGGLDPADAVVLAAQDVAIAGVGDDYDDGVLTVAQLGRAGVTLRAMAEPDGATVADLLASAASTVERAYLLKAVAAGHPAVDLAAFADAIRGRDAAWLHHHLSLVDRGGAGAQDRFGAEVDQYDGFTCGTTSVIVARAETDPLYALDLTRGLEPPYDAADRDEFDRRLSAEQARVHGETNKVWPRRLGTLPTGVAAWMNRHSGASGVRYRWHLVDDTDRRATTAALREVVTAVNRGHPVPILVGGPVPRHYVLAIGHARGDLLIFEPSSGNTVRVPSANFLLGELRGHVGFDHVQAVVVPR